MGIIRIEKEPKKSKGHLCFFRGYEYYEKKLKTISPNIIGHEVFNAPIGNCFDIDTGQRHGRWLCSYRMWKEYYEEKFQD